MPRLNCTYREFVEIISRLGFVLHRQDGGSHQRWRGISEGRPRFIDVAPHRWDDPIPLGTLSVMIRQGALNPKLFRK